MSQDEERAYLNREREKKKALREAQRTKLQADRDASATKFLESQSISEAAWVLLLQQMRAVIAQQCSTDPLAAFIHDTPFG
jgi:hypothetical protein